jgi:hypothetical protein
MTNVCIHLRHKQKKVRNVQKHAKIESQNNHFHQIVT